VFTSKDLGKGSLRRCTTVEKNTEKSSLPSRKTFVAILTSFLGGNSTSCAHKKPREKRNEKNPKRITKRGREGILVYLGRKKVKNDGRGVRKRTDGTVDEGTRVQKATRAGERAPARKSRNFFILNKEKKLVRAWWQAPVLRLLLFLLLQPFCLSVSYFPAFVSLSQRFFFLFLTFNPTVCLQRRGLSHIGSFSLPL